MKSLTQTIRRLDNLAATHELYAAGFGKLWLRGACASGEILRVRQGWYSTPDVHPQLLEAARVGGRLGCISGAALHGMWLPPDAHLHVTVDHNDCRLRAPRDMRRRLVDQAAGVTTHWRLDEPRGSRLLLSPVACLEDIVRCQPIDYAVAIADSALHRRSWAQPALVTMEQWQSVAAAMPSRSQLLARADGACETGTESITRFRLARFRLPMRPQVRIADKRVDFLIGRRLVIEVDGAEYHIDPVRFESDRTRDAELTTIGYIVLRFSYNQVIYRWHEVESAILASVTRGDHL